MGDVETLRRAAALMRERAEAASKFAGESPWGAEGMWWFPLLEIGDDGRMIERSQGFHAVNGRTGAEVVALSSGVTEAQHIASWHPAVALAVADWLEEAADHLAIDGDDTLIAWACPTAHEGLDCSVLGQALTVARAYLGESS